jgi:subfamily B ATP-binding cassette protein MsbA
MKSYLRIIAYLRPFTTHMVLSVVFNILTALFSLFSFLMVVPFLEILFGTTELVQARPELTFSIKSLVTWFNYEVSQLIVNHGPTAALIFICLLVLITSLLKNLFRYLAMHVLAPARHGVTRNIRNQLFQKILSLPLSYFSEEKKGDIITRASSDVQEIEYSLLNTLDVVFKEPITLLFYLITLFVIDPLLTLLILLLLPVTGLVIGRIGRQLKNAATKGQAWLSSLLSTLEESLSGLRIVKAFGAEEKMFTRFRRENELYYRINVGLYRKRDLSSPLTEFLSTIVIVVVLYLGSSAVLKGSLDPGVFIGYLVVFSQLINPSKTFSRAYYQIQKGMASSARVEELLDADIRIAEMPNAIAVSGFEKAIEFKDVVFAYDKEEVLSHVSVTIPKGRMVALVGPSGGGKSTMVDLLPRFYDVVGGQILIDGVDIRQFRIRDLRNLMGMVSQEAILFNDTVFNNIAFGKVNATMEEVIEAAKVANAHDERQRITIARAVLKNPPILILDEATSSLDSHSEKLVQDALFKLMRNRTSIVIAHRLSTIQYADEILVMQHGRIVERGNHIGLMSRNGLYRELVEMQAF